MRCRRCKQRPVPASQPHMRRPLSMSRASQMWSLKVLSAGAGSLGEQVDERAGGCRRWLKQRLARAAGRQAVLTARGVRRLQGGVGNLVALPVHPQDAAARREGQVVGRGERRGGCTVAHGRLCHALTHRTGMALVFWKAIVAGECAAGWCWPRECRRTRADLELEGWRLGGGWSGGGWRAGSLGSAPCACSGIPRRLRALKKRPGCGRGWLLKQGVQAAGRAPTTSDKRPLAPSALPQQLHRLQLVRAACAPRLATGRLSQRGQERLGGWDGGGGRSGGGSSLGCDGVHPGSVALRCTPAEQTECA